MMLSKNIHNKRSLTSFITVMMFLALPFMVKPQGWSFNAQIAYKGSNCTGAQPYALPQISGFQTKAQCEQVRQQILAISVATPSCTLYYTCTECTGSDISMPNQNISGNVSFDNKYEGKPIFTPHNSKAFEDWATGYKQQLESYGIKSILGKSITPNNSLPLSGNNKLDKSYTKDASGFKPKSEPKKATKKEEDYYGKVQLLTSKKEQASRDEWYQKYGMNNSKSIQNNRINDDPAEMNMTEGSEKLKSALDELPYDTKQSKLKAWLEGFVETDFKAINETIEGKRDPNSNLAEDIIKENTTNLAYKELNDAAQGGATSFLKGLATKGGDALMGKLYGKKGSSDFNKVLEATEKGIENGEKGVKWYKIIFE